MKLHSRMEGKTVHSVWKRDNEWEIRFTDGSSLRLCLRDDHGNQLHGHPDILFEGTHIIAKTAHIKRHTRVPEPAPDFSVPSGPYGDIKLLVR